ncbi:transglutaminase-like domain-containing protein [bacterium]|nr:transglutaminase-like domain-containing protein [bacterium]
MSNYKIKLIKNYKQALFLVLFIQVSAIAQSQTPSENGLLSSSLSKSISEKPVESVWEFGLKLTSPSDARGITATVPIPMTWPEQEIEILSEEKSDGVGAIRFKNPTKQTQQFSFSVNRMAAGTSETAIIRFKIKKSLITCPKNTSEFTSGGKLPSEVKPFLKPSPYIESNSKEIRKIASSLEDKSLNAWSQVEKNYTWVRENIAYKFDKQIHSCLRALEVKQGDCEELSSLFIAICRAQGIPARAVWIPGHTYPEFYLTDANQKGTWFPCQAAGSYAFGEMPEPRPILQKGDRFRIAGQRQEVRYLRPTLIAKQATQGVAIEWISKQISTE